jgi:Zn-dependent protease
MAKYSATIATIRGVSLKVHVSLIFLLVYVALVGTVQFPFIVREAGLRTGELALSPLLWGLVFALALFVSVAAHEFGHAFMAQVLGVKVRGITLMMLGGVSEMEQMPEKPYAEFKLAVVGPLVSLGLAGFLYLVKGSTSSVNLYFFSYWLGSANFVLGIFNLLPAFPLDGGRALRSLLAVRQGQLRATQTAARVGKVMAWVLGIFGFLQLNILLMLIAFFIHTMAQNELYFTISKTLLKDLKVGDIARRITPVDEVETLQRVAERMMATQVRLLPVETRDGSAAVLSLDSLRRVDRRFWDSTAVREVMEPALKTMEVSDPVSQALPEVALAPSHALPVRDSGRVVGLIVYSDLSELLQLRSLGQAPPRQAA